MSGFGLRDTSVATKVFLAPLLLMLLFAMQTVWALRDGERQSAGTAELRRVAVEERAVADEIAITGERIQAGLFRVTTFTLMKAPVEQLTPIFNGLDGDVAALRRLTDEAAARPRAGDDKAAMDATVEPLKAFLAGVDNALKSARSNPSFGAAMVRSSGVALDAFLAAIDVFRVKQSEKLNATAEREIAKVETARNGFLALVGFSFALALIVTILVGRSLTKPIRGVTEVMTALAAGDDRAELIDDGRRDELGRMVRAVRVFRANLEEMRTKLARDAESRAVERERARAVLVGDLVDKCEGRVGQLVVDLREAAQRLERVTSETRQAAGRVGREAVSAAAAAGQARDNATGVASAVEELSASIGDMSRGIGRNSEILAGIRGRMGEASSTVRGLADAANAIGAVTDIINKIAAQTNLLALNATIEAARAGEAGRGFAVVAGEVKNLAEQTIRATADIARQITSIQDTTGVVVDVIGDVGTRVEEMNEIAASISATVEQQNGVARDIARNAGGAAEAAGTVSSGVAGVSEAIRGIEGASDDVSGRSAQVADSAEQLDEAIKGLVADIKRG